MSAAKRGRRGGEPPPAPKTSRSRDSRRPNPSAAASATSTAPAPAQRQPARTRPFLLSSNRPLSHCYPRFSVFLFSLHGAGGRGLMVNLSNRLHWTAGHDYPKRTTPPTPKSMVSYRYRREKKKDVDVVVASLILRGNRFPQKWNFTSAINSP